MRTVTLLSALVMSLIASVCANKPAMPRSAHSSHNAFHQVTRQELVAREKHPDLFRKRDQGVQSPDPGPGPGGCGDFLSRRRAVEQVLTAREMAAFLRGRGSFTSANGTTYVDEEYAETLRKSANAQPGYYHRIYNVVKDSVGNKLLEISIPHYKKWKSTLSHGELIYLSPLTTIRTQDVDELEILLLEDPDFVDIQVHGFRINRRFFEVATSF
ncbi:hypothetical protein B0H34DRAFT_406659 [Crassisporium funariophilum]|nr:hypothetical protein B0H34DRAFT_406659 [Crassisporium funariophilum]